MSLGAEGIRQAQRQFGVVAEDELLLLSRRLGLNVRDRQK